MVSVLNYFGIYTSAIENACEKAERLLNKYNLNEEINTMYNWTMEDLNEVGCFEDITNSIISSCFSTVTAIFERRNPKVKIDYYVNCHDSHLYANGEEIY